MADIGQYIYKESAKFCILLESKLLLRVNSLDVFLSLMSNMHASFWRKTYIFCYFTFRASYVRHLLLWLSNSSVSRLVLKINEILSVALAVQCSRKKKNTVRLKLFMKILVFCFVCHLVILSASMIFHVSTTPSCFSPRNVPSEVLGFMPKCFNPCTNIFSKKEITQMCIVT